MIGRVWPPKETWRVCQQFSRFALPLHFTETTIISGDRLPKKKGDWPSTPEGEARQAREVAGFYTLLFSHPAVEAITGGTSAIGIRGWRAGRQACFAAT